MTYKDLVVWQKAHGVAVRIIGLMEETKRSRASDVVLTQLVRAATSVGANVAEGYGRHQGKEYERFLQIAYGSANEVDNWLSVARDAGILPGGSVDPLLAENEEVLRMLATMMRRLRERRAHGATRKVEDEREIYAKA